MGGGSNRVALSDDVSSTLRGERAREKLGYPALQRMQQRRRKILEHLNLKAGGSGVQIYRTIDKLKDNRRGGTRKRKAGLSQQCHRRAQNGMSPCQVFGRMRPQMRESRIRGMPKE